MNRQPTPADHALYDRLDGAHKIQAGYRYHLNTVIAYDISCACGYVTSVESRSERLA